MKIHQKIFILLLILILPLAGCKKPDTYDTYGNPIYLSDYQGKWLIVNYWAPWCKPCLKEMPELNSLYMLYKDRLLVFGVSFDPLTNQEIDKFANKLGVTFPVMQKFPLEKFGVEAIAALPVTFIISPQGKLINTLHGPQTLATLKKALGIPASDGFRIEQRALQKQSN